MDIFQATSSLLETELRDPRGHWESNGHYSDFILLVFIYSVEGCEVEWRNRLSWLRFQCLLSTPTTNSRRELLPLDATTRDFKQTLDELLSFFIYIAVVVDLIHEIAYKASQSTVFHDASSLVSLFGAPTGPPRRRRSIYNRWEAFSFLYSMTWCRICRFHDYII